MKTLPAAVNKRIQGISYMQCDGIGESKHTPTQKEKSAKTQQLENVTKKTRGRLVCVF